jgi:phosphatidate cytidylyltransferase
MAVRLISSFVGIAVALAVLFLNRTFLYPLALAVIIVLILLELIKAVDAQQFRPAVAGVLLYGAATPFLEFYGAGTSENEIVLHFVCLLPVFIEFIRHSQRFRVEQIGFMMMSAFLVTRSICLLISLKNADVHGMLYVVLALCGAWIADSGAYFVGVSLGRHKLCPVISPKKTVEGFVGGIVTNAVVFVLICMGYAYLVRNGENAVTVRYAMAAFLGIACALASVLGDLCASVVKRQKGIKDYGTIMPGHGGMMDRFDSALFVIPTLYVFLSVFSIFE